MRPTIVIPSHLDAKYGFLSSSSHHPFDIEGKVWPTITHFMIAKQFEGTVFEEEIRKTNSITLAKSMSRPRRVIIEKDERMVKKVVYGSDKNYEIRGDWKEASVKYLKRASIAKFDQHPRLKKKLLETEGMKIEDPVVKNYGGLLETIRDNYILEIAKKREPPKDKFTSLATDGYVDLKTKISDAVLRTLGTKVSNEDKGVMIVSSFFSVAKSIKELEGLDRYYPEMFEDVISNLVPLAVGEDLIIHIKLWIDFIFEGWSAISKNMPIFEGLVNTIERRVVSEGLMGLGKLEILRVAVIIASFIRWMNFDAKPDTVEMINRNISIIKKKTIFIPAKPRAYRKDAPLFVSKSPKPKEKTTSFKGSCEFDRVGMTESRGKIFISGKDAKLYETRLLELGGRRKGETIELPLSVKSEVESLFYDSQPNYEHRGNAIYRAWCQKKVDLIVDLVSQISHLISKPPGLHVYKIAARMCGLQRNTIKNGLACPADAKKIMEMSKISPKIQNFLFHYFTFLSLPQKGSFEEICAELDKECGWKGRGASPLVSRVFTKDQCYVIKAIKNIVDIAVLPGKGLGYPHTIEVVVWAFLSLTPRSIRKDAQKYINLILDGYTPEENYEKTTSHLQKSNININLKDLGDYMKNAGMGDEVPVYMLMIISIAISFASHREQEFRYRTLILKGVDKKKEVLEIETVVDPQTPPNDGFRADEKTPLVPKGAIKKVEGDVLRFEDATWILVIANSSSKSPFKPKTRSEIATSKVYKKYAYANVYRSSPPRRLGESIISVPKDQNIDIVSASTSDHRYVATLVCEHSEGGAKKIEDTIDNRKLWFTKALENLGTKLKKGESIAISKDYLGEGYEEIFSSFVEKFCYQAFVITGTMSPKKKNKSILSGDMPPPNKEIIKMPEVLEKDKKDALEKEIHRETKRKLLEEEAEIDRGILYSKIFKPHKLSAESHSKLVRHLERCVPKIREAWLEKFMQADSTNQKIEIDLIVE